MSRSQNSEGDRSDTEKLHRDLLVRSDASSSGHCLL